MNRERYYSGSVTVFLSLILALMISLVLSLVVATRENTRRLVLECAVDASMNAALSEYHRELLEQYDLFFIDTSYGSKTPNYEKTEKHITEYMDLNLGHGEIFLPGLYVHLLENDDCSVMLDRVSAACDEDGKVFRGQCVQTMKQRFGLEYLEEITDWLTTVTEYELDTRDIAKEREDTLESLSGWTEDGEEAKDVPDVTGGVVALWNTWFLSFLTKGDEVSDAAVVTDNYNSHRTPLEGTGMNKESDYKDTPADRMLFMEYIMRYAGHYGEEKEASVLQYQVEYILAGKGEDRTNLGNVAGRLLALRAAADYSSLMNDEERKQQAKVTAEITCALLLIPDMAETMETLFLLTWAMAEAMYDVGQLLKGNRIPLIKTPEQWHYALEKLWTFAFDTTDEEGTGLHYEDYLRIFLALQNIRTSTMRMMDICEMDIRQTEGNENFRMDGCIDSMTAIINVTVRKGKTYTITRNYGYR